MSATVLVSSGTSPKIHGGGGLLRTREQQLRSITFTSPFLDKVLKITSTLHIKGQVGGASGRPTPSNIIVKAP